MHAQCSHTRFYLNEARAPQYADAASHRPFALDQDTGLAPTTCMHPHHPALHVLHLPHPPRNPTRPAAVAARAGVDADHGRHPRRCSSVGSAAEEGTDRERTAPQHDAKKRLHRSPAAAATSHAASSSSAEAPTAAPGVIVDKKDE